MVVNAFPPFCISRTTQDQYWRDAGCIILVHKDVGECSNSLRELHCKKINLSNPLSAPARLSYLRLGKVQSASWQRFEPLPVPSKEHL